MTNEVSGAAVPPSREGAPSGAPIAWASLLALAAGHFAVDCCTGIWPVYKTLARLDLARAGLVATVGSLVGNGLQLAFGLVADRGLRKHLAVAGVLTAGAVTLLPWTSSWGTMGALVLTTFVGSAAFHPSATGATAALSSSRTGFLVGAFLIGGYAGYALSQILFAALFARSPSSTAALLVLPTLAAGGIVALVPPMPAGGAGSRGAWACLRPQLPAFVPLFLVQVFATAINLSLIFLLPDLLLSRQAPPWMVQGGGHFALVAGAGLSLLPAGHAADRWGARRFLLAANTGTGVLLALLLASGTATLTDLGLVLAFGAFNGMNGVVAVSEGNRLLPGRASGASALLMGLPWCVAASAAALAGNLADPSRGGSPTSALAWMGLAIPLALLAAAGVRDHRAAVPAGATGS